MPVAAHGFACDQKFAPVGIGGEFMTGDLTTVISRTALRLATAAAVACASRCRRLRFDYPTKPVCLIFGVAAGGANDAVALLVAQALFRANRAATHCRESPRPRRTLALKPSLTRRWMSIAERPFALQAIFRSSIVLVPVHFTNLPPSNNGTASDLNQ